MVGYVELGTDSWISKITARSWRIQRTVWMLFSYTSMLMFALRFFAGPIVHRTSPLGLLFAGAILGATGLTLLGSAECLDVHYRCNGLRTWKDLPLADHAGCCF